MFAEKIRENFAGNNIAFFKTKFYSCTHNNLVEVAFLYKANNTTL